jgi:hypothetical protein
LTRRHRTALPLVAVSAAAVLLSGCGGSSSDDTVRVRSVNAIPNGGAVTIDINGSAYAGNQDFFQSSSYLYVGSGNASFTLALSALPGTAFPATAQAIVNNDYYTAIALGRSDVTSAADPRYPKVEVIADDRTAPPAGDARIRVIQAAPDAPNIDVLIDGQVVASNIPYQTAGAYFNVASGSHSIQVNQAGTGTPIVSAKTQMLSAGQLYSLFTVESTITPSVTYAEQLLDDSTNIIS